VTTGAELRPLRDVGKFPSATDERAVTKGELLTLQLAARAGITAAQARVVDNDGFPVALVRRFDRVRHAATRDLLRCNDKPVRSAHEDGAASYLG
jgi:hypothetical protein